MKKHIPAPCNPPVTVAQPAPLPPIRGRLSIATIVESNGRALDLYSVMDFVTETDWSAIDYCDHEHAADVIESLYWYFADYSKVRNTREKACFCMLSKVFSPGATDTGISEENIVGELTIA